MQNALGFLQSARSELNMAEHDKGGHRTAAVNLVNQAITQVQAGMAVGAGRQFGRLRPTFTLPSRQTAA